MHGNLTFFVYWLCKGAISTQALLPEVTRRNIEKKYLVSKVF